jgi:hypothetical protein
MMHLKGEGEVLEVNCEVRYGIESHDDVGSVSELDSRGIKWCIKNPEFKKGQSTVLGVISFFSTLTTDD